MTDSEVKWYIRYQPLMMWVFITSISIIAYMGFRDNTPPVYAALPDWQTISLHSLPSWFAGSRPLDILAIAAYGWLAVKLTLVLTELLLDRTRPRLHGWLRMSSFIAAMCFAWFALMLTLLDGWFCGICAGATIGTNVGVLVALGYGITALARAWWQAHPNRTGR